MLFGLSKRIRLEVLQYMQMMEDLQGLQSRQGHHLMHQLLDFQTSLYRQQMAVQEASVSKTTSSVGSSKSRQSSVDSRQSASSVTTVDTTTRPVSSEDIYNIVTKIWTQLKKSVGREYTPFQYSGPSNCENGHFHLRLRRRIILLKQLMRPNRTMCMQKQVSLLHGCIGHGWAQS